MELIQSFIYTISRSKLTLYEQRLMLKIVEHAQSRIAGIVVKDNLYKWDHDFDNVHMTVSIKDVLSTNSQHYEQVREAARTLMSRRLEYQDAATNNWFATPLIYNVRHDGRSGVLDFYVSRKVFDIILDFSKGFRQYSLEAALSIDSPFASRLYALVCGQESPFKLEIPKLKKMFGVEDKYKQTRDFIKKVIESSKVKLDNAGHTTFTYKPVKQGIKIVAIMFFPILREQKTVPQQNAKIATSFFLTKEMKIMLMQQVDFTLRELGPHKELLDDFAKLPESYSILADIVNRSFEKKNRKGYVIAAMKSEVKEFKKKQPQEATDGNNGIAVTQESQEATDGNNGATDAQPVTQGELDARIAEITARLSL